MQLKDVLDAYAQRDVERARAVWTHDAELDALEDSVFRDLLTFMMEDPRNISFCTHLLFCSKNLERIGDHATNIAETVVYLVTGETLPTERPKTRGPSSSAAPAIQEPIAAMNEPRADDARRASAGVGAPRILVVEDEAALALLLAYNLEAEGLSSSASSAATRPSCGSPRAPPDLVILDWMLPGVSGLEICRRLRAREATRDAAGDHADGARRGGRARARPVGRRRRLCGQAVLGARADGARARAAAPRAAGARRRAG